MRRLLPLLILPLALAAAGCWQSKLLPGEAYVQADRETLESAKSFGPVIRGEVAPEPVDAMLYDAWIAAWESRVTAAENRYAAMRRPQQPPVRPKPEGGE